MRILLFRECDWRGRRLLFDSSAIELVTTTTTTSTTTNTTATSPTTPLPSQKQQQQQKQQHDSHQTQNNCALNVTQSTRPSPLKLDKNNIEYYEGKPYKVRRLNYYTEIF